MKSKLKISIVSPVYKSELLVDRLVDRIISSVSNFSDSYEIILVEDGGVDESWRKIVENCKKHSTVKGIRLSKNFGQQYAIQAGLDASQGEYVVTMDCDLQDQPEEIINLYNKAQEGYEVVVASRKNRQDSLVKRMFSKVFYDVLGYLTETKQDNTVANFVCYHRNVVKAMSEVKDYNRYYPMLQQIVGFKYTKINVEHAQRELGKSSYSYSARIRLAINTILTFSDKPLRLTVKLGVFLAIISILIAIVMVVMHVYNDIEVRGWASLALMISFFSGLIIAVLGVVGLYVGKTFESVKRRPTYIIQESINNDNS